MFTLFEYECMFFGNFLKNDILLYLRMPIVYWVPDRIQSKVDLLDADRQTNRRS